ncbi:MAG: diguanylate cyclase [Psychromonas sp.]
MLEESENGLELILKEGLDLSLDCFGILNQEDIVIHCNNTFANVFGITKEQAIGRSNKELLRSAWATKQGIIIDTDDFNQWYQNIDSLHKEKGFNQFETDLSDGRWFKMTRVNMERGYIMFFGVDITDLKKTQKSLEEANRHIENLANTDQLTGLNNRRAFHLIADQEIKKARRYKQPLSLLLIDMDYFKQINDNYGHEAGDFVLHEFATLCQTLLRLPDLLCRIGGEEFVILLPMTGEDGARQIAERICVSVASHDFYFERLNCFIHVSVSIGLSYLSGREQSIQEILTRADVALYTAKQNGRNQVREYS